MTLQHIRDRRAASPGASARGRRLLSWKIVTSFQPGDVIGGRYRLIRVMGAGAMGVVWSARNESTERDFAIKLMMPDAAKDPARLQRFFKEAKLAGRLRHRCIVEVYDLGRLDDAHGGAPYLVMELLDGEPLDSMLRRVGKLPSGTALRIIRDVAQGLEVAHAQGIVHRDLKPANVFLHRGIDGRTVPKILDFGISKLVAGGGAFDAQETTIGTILGSPAYMSPEQTAGEDLDARADVWALGVVLYKALCGELPYVAANFTSLMLAINTQDPKPLEERVPGIPREVHAIVARCLSRRRTERFPRAGALADAIDEVLESHDLPVLELSQVVGEAAPIPSEHMKTAQVAAFNAGSTLPFGVTTPTRAFGSGSHRVERTRRLDGDPAAHVTTLDAPGLADPPKAGRVAVIDGRTPVIGVPRVLSKVESVDESAQIVDTGQRQADVTGALAATQPAHDARPRRRVLGVVALMGAALLAAFFVVRARTAPEPVPATASSAPLPALAIEPAPAIESAAPSSVAEARSAKPDEKKSPTHKSDKSDKTKPAKPAPKPPAAKPPKTSSTSAPHEGLVHPGF